MLASYETSTPLCPPGDGHDGVRGIVGAAGTVGLPDVRVRPEICIRTHERGRAAIPCTFPKIRRLATPAAWGRPACGKCRQNDDRPDGTFLTATHGSPSSRRKNRQMCRLVRSLALPGARKRQRLDPRAPVVAPRLMGCRNRRVAAPVHPGGTRHHRAVRGRDIRTLRRSRAARRHGEVRLSHQSFQRASNELPAPTPSMSRMSPSRPPCVPAQRCTRQAARA